MSPSLAWAALPRADGWGLDERLAERFPTLEYSTDADARIKEYGDRYFSETQIRLPPRSIYTY